METLGVSNKGEGPHPVVGEEGHPALVKQAPLDLFTTPTRPCHSVSQSDFKAHSSEMSSAVCCKRSTVGWRKTGNV